MGNPGPGMEIIIKGTDSSYNGMRGTLLYPYPDGEYWRVALNASTASFRFPIGHLQRIKSKVTWEEVPW